MKNVNIKMAIGGFIIATLVLMAFLAPYIVGGNNDPISNDIINRLMPPSSTNILGTDHLGRDVFSRIIYGSRLTLGISFTVLTVSIIIGVSLGIIAGYYRGVLDSVIMTLVEILLAFPSMILSLAVVGIMGAGLNNAVIAVSLVSWIGYARLVRGAVFSIKERDFVKASRLSGSSDIKIILIHILPNVITSVIVYAATNISNIIVQIASLSFLGLGVQPPVAEWGNMLNEAKGFISTAPWLILSPSISLIILITGFNLFGEGLAELINNGKKGGYE